MSQFSFRNAEERLWKEGAEAFRDFLHPEAVMALPKPGPIIQGDAILKSIEGFPRWDSVVFRSVREAQTSGAHVFAYEASATRGDEDYHAACLTVWVAEDDGWRLLSHSQTRVPDED